ncbi:MAG TPA: hypothetical protein VF149_04450 [Bacillales bacterium]
MKGQRQKLSYARLVSRTDFYKKKALELEQKVVFGDEKIKALEEELEQLNGEEQPGELEELQRQFEQLKEDYENLEAKGSAEEIERLSGELQEKTEIIDSLKDDDGKEESKADEGRVEQFEKLLAEVQTELNQKEQQLDTYKGRVKSLEKRLSSKQSVPGQRVFSDENNVEKAGKKVIAYFDYSLVLSQQRESIIRGNFHVENVGSESLGTPFVCFRFYPLDASTLKGKIISIEQAERNGDHGSGQPQWVYLDDDWGEKAKERGEIWVRPYDEIRLKPHEKTSLADFQIPVKKHFDENVIVEGFVYFQDDRHRTKAVNQILITF